MRVNLRSALVAVASEDVSTSFRIRDPLCKFMHTAISLTEEKLQKLFWPVLERQNEALKEQDADAHILRVRDSSGEKYVRGKVRTWLPQSVAVYRVGDYECLVLRPVNSDSCSYEGQLHAGPVIRDWR